jgi:transposase
MKKLYMGNDLGVKVCAWHILDQESNTIDKGEFETSEQMLISSVQGHPGEVHLLIEECELSGWAYRALLPHVKTIQVCDPRYNALISKASNKSDPVDAHKLAEYLRIKSFRTVYNPKDEEMAAFKKGVQHEIRYTKLLSKAKLQIKAQLRREGVNYSGQNPYTVKGIKKLVEKIDNETIRGLILQNFRMMKHLEEEKKIAIARLRSFLSRIPILRNFLEVPGVGIQLASRFVAFVQTPHRFSSIRKLWRYCKLGIVKRSSDGNPIGRERLDYNANGVLKDMSRKAFMAAQACRKDNLFKRTYRRSLERTRSDVHARLNTQRKIIAVLYAMWRDGVHYNDLIDRV